MRPRPSKGDRSRVLQHWPYVIIFSISVLSTVRVTRAPMGTKATPTASLSAASVFPLGAQHFVVSAQITIQPTKMSIIDWLPPQKKTHESHVFTFSVSDHYGFMDWASGAERPAVTSQTVTEQVCVISTRLSTLLQTWNELKLRNILGREGKRGDVVKTDGRTDVMV